MTISTSLPCGMQDAQFDGQLDLAYCYAPQVTCASCGAEFAALCGSGEYGCRECGGSVIVVLSQDAPAISP